MGVFNNTFGNTLVQLGATLNYNQPWTNVPYFALPENGVSLIAGKTVTIYGDTLVNAPIINHLLVTYTCAIGTQVGNNLVLTTPAAGNYPCVVNIKNGTKLIGEYPINLKVEALAPTKAIKILAIGDSVLHNGFLFDWYPNAIAATLTNNTFTYKGTKGTTYKHEGIDGWQWQYFSTAGSPFFKAGVLDIAAYFTDNSLDVPDFVVIQLGVNEIAQNSATYDNELTDADIVTITNYAKVLIDGFLAFDSTLKIQLELPTLTGAAKTAWDLNFPTGLINQDLFIAQIHKYSAAFVSMFANGTYNARVNCGYSRVFVNRTTGYDDLANSALHPVASGGNEIGIGIALGINKNINSLYGAELIDQSLYKVNPLTTYWNTVMAGFSSDGSNITVNTGWGLLGGPKPFSLTTGKSYRIEVVFNRTSGTLYLSDNASNNIGISSSGRSVNIFTAANGGFYFLAMCVGSISYLSIKEIL